MLQLLQHLEVRDRIEITPKGFRPYTESNL